MNPETNMKVTGIKLGGSNKDKIIEYAILAENKGMDSIWIGESWGSASIPLLTLLLKRTETIDVCSGIINIFSRTPALISMTANTLADIGDGRLRIGLGVSGPKVIENFHGVEFEQPLRRTREYIEIMRYFMNGERVDYDGEIFNLSGFELNVTNYYKYPIYTAAMGKKNRKLTGEFADGWIPILVPNNGLREAINMIKVGADRRGRSLSEIDIAPWVPTCISENRPQTARRHVRSFIAFYVGAMGEYYANSVASFGFCDETTMIKNGWRDDGLKGARNKVTKEMVNVFGAAGTPSEAAKSFDRFNEAGANSPIAYIPTQWADDELTRETISYL